MTAPKTICSAPAMTTIRGSEREAGLEFRTRLAQRNVQALAEPAAVPANHSTNQIGELS